ncbi:transglutaminase family protein [Ruania alkalisoli]|uniref:Transglutaminase family protein n=1 Tax=Ruania alkalisoli TaxID=2779775 RepID=A0A7M1SNV8_9MICO|nr:transglutaminase family protein [Ruania alkalisoli]QOR69249.1 transglutaminase family protein [Ruania alkalisoli]
MSRLHIVHRTTFEYVRTVTASYNEVRMRPATLPGQVVLEASVHASPSTYSSEYRDYWGSSVTAFEMLGAHDRLEVVAESRVELSAPVRSSSPAGWSTLRSPEVQDRMSEYLAVTPTTEPARDLVQLARSAAGDHEPADAAIAVATAVREAVEYVPGVTGVHTRAAEAWAARKGVCQDLAHLVAGALRRLGIPTRYVSGYLHPQTSTAQIGEPVTGESHAWVEYWCGEWVGFDPTNLIGVAEHHVMVGRGREYPDVTPIRGVYAGGGRSTQEVQVTIIQEA